MTMNTIDKERRRPSAPPLAVGKASVPAARARGRFERWLDRHNHEMEFLRTLFGLSTISLQVVILLKIFNYI